MTSKIFFTLILLTGTMLYSADPAGTTRITKWKDDKACAFILMFDDSSDTHVKNVFPELKKRDLTGTFYINPGSGHYAANKMLWEKTIPEAGFELGNHTLTHKGGDSSAEVVAEITSCNDVIHKNTPSAPWPRLVSFAKPGGLKKGKWPLSPEEQETVLEENLLIIRPVFNGRGAQIHLKTGAQMLAHVDKAVKNGSMECIIFHGVGGDWISVPLPEFIILLDGLTERKESVWVTHHTAAYKYAKLRDTAVVKIVESSPRQISLQLSSNLNHELFDQQLTLETAVPPTWEQAIITQGNQVTEIEVKNNLVRYDALPGRDLIKITKR